MSGDRPMDAGRRLASRPWGQKPETHTAVTLCSPKWETDR